MAVVNLKSLSHEMYEFCPDVVDQGAGSVEELERGIKLTNSFYLWWD